MTAPARPSPARPAGAPRRATPRPPALTVVRDGADGGALRSVRRWRRSGDRLAVVVAVGLAAAGLVLMVTLHVALAQGQFRLEQLQREASREQAAYDRLRLRVAELESPGRVVAVARDRLGMVAPARVTYLTPTAGAAAALVREDRPRLEEAASNGWSTVKPHLAARAGG